MFHTRTATAIAVIGAVAGSIPSASPASADQIVREVTYKVYGTGYTRAHVAYATQLGEGEKEDVDLPFEYTFELNVNIDQWNRNALFANIIAMMLAGSGASMTCEIIINGVLVEKHSNTYSATCSDVNAMPGVNIPN